MHTLFFFLAETGGFFYPDNPLTLCFQQLIDCMMVADAKWGIQ